MERASEIIGVEARDDDALPHIAHAHDEVDHAFAEELRFVDADDLGAPVKTLFQFGGIAHAFRLDLQVAMRNDVIVGIALIDAGLEYLYALARNLRATQTADQFFALAAEHWAGDDFDPA